MEIPNKNCPGAKDSSAKVNRDLMQMSCYCAEKLAPSMPLPSSRQLNSDTIFLSPRLKRREKKKKRKKNKTSGNNISCNTHVSCKRPDVRIVNDKQRPLIHVPGISRSAWKEQRKKTDMQDHAHKETRA